MAGSFNGSFEHTIDSKGRLSIPARFREVLYGKGDNRVMITNFFVEDLRFLDVYPVDEWLRMQEELKKKAKFDRRMIVFETFYIGNAAECAVDNQGRILIPANLRRYANLKKNVVMTGVIEKFRIWDKDAHQRVVSEAEEKLDAEFLNGLLNS
ncbi:MAG TPA: division/cell wall cluster transcriptional repressor MraZ [Candidatus Acidoferrales bacterium]|nr:division/cell wall cluster transcriptional repressor MraZ [Candidatus Acidoferrales bacterium]